MYCCYIKIYRSLISYSAKTLFGQSTSLNMSKGAPVWSGPCYTSLNMYEGEHRSQGPMWAPSLKRPTNMNENITFPKLRWRSVTTNFGVPGYCERISWTQSALYFKFLSQINGKFDVQESNKPGEAIVQVAKEWDAVLVVMGSRGLGTLARTFLGSVSTYVVHHAHCAVLVHQPHQS